MPRETWSARSSSAGTGDPALTRDLSRAVGLGRRSRRAASASERARQSIAKTIKSVLERIAQSDSTLADILSRCIRTGAFCSYQPDPVFPIAWEFASSGAVRQSWRRRHGEPVAIFVKVAGVVLAMAIACGCASQSAPPKQEAARPSNRYIYVTSEGLPGDCYTDLGAVELTQPFADAAVDQDNSETAKRLRAVALENYPKDVDAVIDVQSEQNDVGSEVTVKGEAVRLEDRPTVQCTLRGAKGVMDQAAVLGAAGIAGATAGGLMAGASAATSVGVAGAAMMGAHQVIQHEQDKEQLDAGLRKSLDDQHREIAQLLKERSRLQQCKQEEVPLSACLKSAPNAGQSAQPTLEETDDQATFNAMPFEIRRQIQEQQDYIKQLQGQIAQLKFEINGH